MITGVRPINWANIQKSAKHDAIVRARGRSDVFAFVAFWDLDK